MRKFKEKKYIRIHHYTAFPIAYFNPVPIHRCLILIENDKVGCASDP